MKKTIIIIFALLVSTISFSQEKKYITYRVTDNETITSIAKKLGVTPYDLLKLNPDAKDGINIDEVIIIPNKNYKSNVSKEQPLKRTVNKFQKDSIKDGILYHRVKFGETIYSLSKKYGVKKKKVLKLNKLKKRSKISLGQLLKFPTKKKDTYSEIVEIKNPVIKSEFLNYTVKADDTKYSLAKKHKISVEKLEEINPQLKGKTLNEYDVISLPTNVEAQVNGKETITESVLKTHVVQSQETFFKITRLYNTTKEELIYLNPVLINGLKVGMEIKIPNESKNVSKSIFKTHKIKAKETFFSLNRMYGVTKEELIALNPELKKGLKIGMTIKIFDEVVIAESLLNLDSNFSGKKLEVVMMLPFKAAEKSSTSIKTDKKLNRITDFYLGAKMALDNLKKKGLSVNLKVFDTKGDKATVSNIINTNDFANTDAIIGPMYFRNIEQISKTFKNKNTPIISPVASNDHNSLNVIQNMVSNKQLRNKILDFIKSNYANQNIVIIADEVKKSKSKTDEITNYLKLHDSINKVTVLHLEDGYIKKSEFEKNIDKKKENWVILVSDNKTTSVIAVDNLGVLSKNFKVTLFAFKKGNNFKDVKNSFLNRLNFHYPTINFIDNDNEELTKFNQNYKLKYDAKPSSFVYKGYDTTYDALLRIATYQNIDDSFQAGKTKGLTSQFDYKKTNATCYKNSGIYIVKYKAYQIVRVR